MAPAAASIIRYFLIRPEGCPHGREIQRVLGLGGASVQRELERLVSLGALARTQKGRRVHFAMGPNAQFWAALSLLVGITSDPTQLIQDALKGLSGVRAAFLFGSTAEGNQRDDSDVDLFVLEVPEADHRPLLRQVAAAASLLGREVNTLRYTDKSIADRLGDSSHPGATFIREVLEGPKQWLVGSPAPLLLLAAAAGIRLPGISAESG
ncbi:MAG: nucleotidyltransferase domain-containing protein [Gemmatimonadota bacterium]